MPENHLIYGFTAGEVSPEFYGRTDLTKFALGVGVGENWIVNFKGPMTTRAGSRYILPMFKSGGNVKLIRFRHTGDDYVLVFGDEYMRVARSSRFILNASKTITGITKANPGVVTTSAAHGYDNSDWVFIDDVNGMTEVNGKFYTITVLTTTTYRLRSLVDGSNVDTTGFGTYTSGGTSSSVFTLDTPYTSADIPGLSAEQRLNEVTLTHLNHKRQKLTFGGGDTDWVLSTITSGSNVPTPTGVTATPSTAGSAGAVYVVTAVSQGGVESLPSAFTYATDIVDFTVTAGSLTLKWTAIDDISHYNVYRSLVTADSDDLSASMELGFIGRALGNTFLDRNIINDFTKLPPLGLDPFADNAILFINITTAGSGYTNATVVGITDSNGSGFVGYPVVSSTGTMVGVIIINGGSGYTNPTVTFTVGSGAVAATVRSPADGNNPKIFKTFQQRGVYVATDNLPMTMEGSKPGAFNNFDISPVLVASDAYSFTLDQQSVRPIKHVVTLRSGLLLFTDSAIEQLRAQDGVAISPLNAIAETQAYKGASDVVPIPIDLDILFTQQVIGNLFVMTFTPFGDNYEIQDLSILSSHLFGAGKTIVSMTYAPEPSKLLYCIREDGVRLMLTYLRDQQVFAWTRDTTKGEYQDNLAITEGNTSVVYQVVERTLATGTTQYLEVVQSREFPTLEDTWAVDCGLDYPQRFLNTTCLPDASTGSGVGFNFGSSISGNISVGDVLYVGGGKAKAVTINSSILVTCDILSDVTAVQPQDANNTPLTQAAGDWSVSTPTTVVSGLDHLEGEEVSVLADGNASLDIPVENGSITLATEASKIVIGLPYLCKLRTLSVLSNGGEQVEGRFKTVLGIAPRIWQTRGLTVGNSFDLSKQQSMKDRTDEQWGEALNLRTDMPLRFLSKTWDRDGFVYFVQKWPLPATLLGYVLSVELGEL